MNTKICLVSSCFGLLAFGAGCSGDSSTVTVEPHPTIIELSPRDFLGALRCGTGASDLQRYVATLTDVTRMRTEASGDGGAPALDFDLPSSLPIRCEQGVAFGLVVTGHFYTAQVDGYDRSDLEPLASGAPVMVDPTGKPVAPRWTTTCGTPCPPDMLGCPATPLPPNPRDTGYSFAVRAEYELTRPMQPCWAWSNP